ncbi:hypothetical protein DAPPUDRAFT_104187 [Daphnia pulex]|uniref:Ionotropic glutamate receptor C-terminal domain-containing protein n=1 Tax=Daphnia pulex TaxID=6669 RepID=E9GLI1_DAPPU|nr:hypothetical protein DAPPUDRAFT_104187 [Daphnia pulex]|eukprot:EFX79522.1 hypothetical protein DAPPUDRAFT_104187 [Daphnia pulex]
MAKNSTKLYKKHLVALISEECDLILAVIRQTPERLRLLELLHPWMYSQTAFIIPMPEVSQNNVDAVIKPFQLWVWMALILAFASVIAILSCFNRLFQSKGRSIIEQDNPSTFPSVRVTESIFMYVVGTLLNQGGYISNTFTPIRLVVGAWCLLTLVLLNVYNGVLISYVTEAGRPQPLINTFDDVLSDSRILLVLDKGFAGDIVISTAEKGLYKTMKDKLNAHPNSRCLSTQQCIDLVKSLPPRYVYLNAVVGLKAAIKKDYMQTRQCKLTIAGEPPFMKQAAGWGLAKNSPYREEFNRGTARLFDVGLTSFWQNWYEPDSKPCYDDKDNGGLNKNEKKPLVRLSLTNLTGAFAVLAVGCAMSILTFLAEIIIFLKKESDKKWSSDNGWRR